MLKFSMFDDYHENNNDYRPKPERLKLPKGPLAGDDQRCSLGALLQGLRAPPGAGFDKPATISEDALASITSMNVAIHARLVATLERFEACRQRLEALAEE